MKVFDEVYVRSKRATDILCNKCGESCVIAREGPHLDVGASLLDNDICGGYGSKYIADMERHKFDLCECCVSELIATFKISSLVK